MWVVCACVLFFFKQKTAYEMHISDWSSDVCSSDLDSVVTQVQKELKERGYYDGSIDGKTNAKTRAAAMRFQAGTGASSGDVQREIGRASCRERGCQYVSISVVTVSLKKQSNDRSGA